MTNPNPTQLLLLADHIKLSLLERQRAMALQLEPNAQDAHISRSLAALGDGVEAVSRERRRLEEEEEEGREDEVAAKTLKDQESRLRTLFEDLTAQFHGFPTSLAASTTNNTTTAAPPPETDPSSNGLQPSSTTNKSVRFSDNNNHNPTVSDLPPYHDDPDPDLDPSQIHAYHTRLLRDQDAHLDALGASIGRQREFSILIGDELDTHIQLLDDVDVHLTRHQSRLDQAKRRLTRVAGAARDNAQWTLIAVLVLVLVALVVLWR